jgi:thiamine biosynthesis lipoprotein
VQKLEFRAMGCHMLAALDMDSPPAAARLAQAPGWFESWEGALSRFRADSELSRLNRSAGRPAPVSKVLWQVIQAAMFAAESSEGLVTPAILPALEAAGYDQTFELVGQGPSWEGRLAGLPSGCGDWRTVECDASARVVRLPAGLRLDLGGIAKGWAADAAARRLRSLGPALVDAGGDVAASGPRADGQPWPVGVADPLHPGQTIALLALGRGGVATSGRDYRRWQADGVWRHHILDPRTGQPAETDILAATVVGPSAAQSEVAAKAALILGGRDGLAWLEARPDFAGLLALEDGRVLVSRRMNDYLWSE